MKVVNKMNIYETTKKLKDFYSSLKYGERYFVDEKDKDVLMEAIELIQKQNEELEYANKKLNSAIEDIKRAKEKTQEMQNYLDNEIYPIVDYSYFLSLFEYLCDIVKWKNNSIWGDENE